MERESYVRNVLCCPGLVCVYFFFPFFHLNRCKVGDKNFCSATVNGRHPYFNCKPWFLYQFSSDKLVGERGTLYIVRCALVQCAG